MRAQGAHMGRRKGNGLKGNWVYARGGFGYEPLRHAVISSRQASQRFGLHSSGFVLTAAGFTDLRVFRFSNHAAPNTTNEPPGNKNTIT
jgi:hypothetical protein